MFANCKLIWTRLCSWRTLASSVDSDASTGSSGAGSALFKFKRRNFVFRSLITVDSEGGPGRWCGIGI